MNWFECNQPGLVADSNGPMSFNAKRPRTWAYTFSRRATWLFIAGAVAVSACTGDGAQSGDEFFSDGELVPITVPAGEGLADEPTPELPDGRLDRLVVSTLDAGAGRSSEVGDTLFADYVGVRSDDGSKFDSTYGFSPLGITLGLDLWIEGWERGLVGAQEGERRQLDIPSELAYGEEGSGRGIGKDEDLTFVFDIRLIVAAADPVDVPTEPGVSLRGRSFETMVDTLADGDGQPLTIDDVAVFRYVVFRGDDGTSIADRWMGEPSQDVDVLPGLRTGMSDMTVGERRAITIPPENGFGIDGSPANGIPPETDIIYVVELVRIL